MSEDAQSAVLIVGASPDMVVLARILGVRGYRIGLMSRTEAKLRESQKALISEGISCEVFPCDVTDSTAITSAMTDFACWSPRLDCMVYNVGIESSVAAVETTQTEFERVMETNFFGFVNCFQFALHMFKRFSGGSVVILSSSRALSLAEQPVAYAASKSALQIYVSALRNETEKYKVSFSEVFLGRKRDGELMRWLTDDEIASGVLEAIERHPKRLVIGEP